MGKQWKQWQTLFFGGGGSKITEDGDCSPVIKRHLLLRRKAIPNLDSILKSRDLTLQKNVSSQSKALLFLVFMYGCESWTIKKAEHWRIDVFELWCWRRLLRGPWTARRPNQSILKEFSPWIFIGRTDAEAEAPILWQPDAKNWLTVKDLMLGKIKGGSRKGRQRMRWLKCITYSIDVSLSKPWSCWWTGKPGIVQ